MSDRVRKLFDSFEYSHQAVGRLAHRHKSALIESAIVREFANREIIVPLGELVDGVHFVAEGGLRLESLAESGTRFLVNDLQTGDVFGFLSVLDQAPSLHEVSAHGSTVSVFIPAERFRGLVYSDRDLMRTMIAILCQRLRMSLLMITRFAPGGQSNQVARCLVAVADQRCLTTKVIKEVRLPINQSDIAAMLSISWQSVNKILKQFLEKNLISIRYNQIIVRDLAGLRLLQ